MYSNIYSTGNCNSLLAGLPRTSIEPIQLPAWCSILAFIIIRDTLTPALQQLHCIVTCCGRTELNASCVLWCIKSTLDVHHATATCRLTVCSQSLNPAVDPVWGPPTIRQTLPPAAYVHQSLVNVVSVLLVQQPGTLYLTALNSPLHWHQQILKTSKISSIPSSILIFVSTREQSVSRTLHCYVYCIYNDICREC